MTKIKKLMSGLDKHKALGELLEAKFITKEFHTTAKRKLDENQRRIK